MGKRKIHGSNFFFCDWTGFPMKASNCHLPSWTEDGKLVKKGSYCNWESTYAHALHQRETLPKFDAVVKYIVEQTGVPSIDKLRIAPHYSELAHFKADGIGQEYFHAECTKPFSPIEAVKITDTGLTERALVDTVSMRLQNGDGFGPALPARSMRTFRKGKRDREICVFYDDPMTGLQLNALASSIFKMQMHGPVIVMHCSKEMSFLPRERYLDYTLEELNEQYMKKRKKAASEGFTSVEFGELKDEMQTQLRDLESQQSKNALAPQAVRLRKIAPTTGKKLKEIAEARSQAAP